MYETKSRWQPQLQALYHLRKEQGAHLKKPVWILIVAIIVFFGLVLRFGVEATMGGTTIVFAIVLSIVGRKRLFMANGWTQQRVQLERKSLLVEERILRGVAEATHPAIRFAVASPDISEPLQKSGLIGRNLEYVNPSRSLAGCYNGVAFCAAYVDAGYYESFQNSEGETRQIAKPVFQGVVVLADFPNAKDGWVTLHSDNLEKLGWLANEWRHASDENYVRLENVEFEKYFNVRASSSVDGHRMLPTDVMERFATFRKGHIDCPIAMAMREQTIIALIPMRASPFVIRDNSDLWSSELDRLREVSTLISKFIAIVTPQENTPANATGEVA